MDNLVTAAKELTTPLANLAGSVASAAVEVVSSYGSMVLDLFRIGG